MLICGKCGREVKENACEPCQKKIQSYICQNCGAKIYNPKYRKEQDTTAHQRHIN